MAKKEEPNEIGQKSRETEERIIQAAMEVFSRCPVDVATLRMVAKEANIPHSLVVYHFKNKGNLYRIVLDRVMILHKESHEPFFPILDEQQALTKKEAKDAIIAIAHGIVDRMYNPNAKAYQKVLLFEMSYPSRYYDYIYSKHIKRCFDLALYLFEAATGINDRERLYFDAVTHLGQIVSFMQERETLVRGLGITGFTVEETAKIKKYITEQIYGRLGKD